MGEVLKSNTSRKPVAVVVGATSKWQSDGRNTKLAHGKIIDDSDVPVSVRWGVGGAIAQKFASEGFFTVLTTRNASKISCKKQLSSTETGILDSISIPVIGGGRSFIYSVAYFLKHSID